MATKVFKARTSEGIKAAVRHGAKALRAGKLVAFPTETVYGVGAMATDPAAVERLRELKSRPKEPFAVHLGRPQDVSLYVAEPCEKARRLMLKAWPGPVTVLLPTGGRLAEKRFEKAGLHELLTRDEMIGLRCPDDPVASKLLSTVAAPVVATSANLARAASPRSAEEVLKALDGQIDLLIDSGPTRYGKDSTIVGFSGGAARIVRKGVLDARAIRELLKWRLLLVCTGNTCRSPMALGLARKLLAEKFNCRVGELPRRGLDVLSAGVFAAHGIKAAGEAVAAAKRLGADISRHRSKKLTSDLIRSADLVLCMTRSHVDAVVKLVPAAAGRTQMLDKAGDIADPIGGGYEAYRATAARIQRALKAHLDEVLTG
ncbi:MAG: L-threonylcarbamoyladenylate synthase [Planctomycetota bacterium]|jgi:tRNA threonylcarbamoyl adenosine modification protein (Sua5/YciO/YrdC/YwlC family)